MDINKRKFVVVLEKSNEVAGIVTDGDIRRAIWKGTSLSSCINEIMTTDFVYCENESDHVKIRQGFDSSKIKQIPVIKDGFLVNVVFREEFEAADEKRKPRKLEMPVVIMAGGKGTRLDPFTKILPKALIPVGEKPIIEIIINNFQKFGIDKFYVSINHKARMIQAFFEDYHEELNLKFITEEKPLGTIGSLRCLPDPIGTSIIVTNCDIIIHHDYAKIAEFHNREKYDITIVASMRHYKIPYGVCEITNGADLIDINEKPEYDFLVNTGMYILEPDLLEFIPHNEYYDMTDLIKICQKNGKKIGVYPISEKSWLDVGQWEEYNRAVQEL